jgi:hypothetical protein
LGRNWEHRGPRGAKTAQRLLRRPAPRSRLAPNSAPRIRPRAPRTLYRPRSGGAGRRLGACLRGGRVILNSLDIRCCLALIPRVCHICNHLRESLLYR